MVDSQHVESGTSVTVANGKYVESSAAITVANGKHVESSAAVALEPLERLNRASR